MEIWDEFEQQEADDPVVDLDQLVDMLTEHYGLFNERDDTIVVEALTTH